MGRPQETLVGKRKTNLAHVQLICLVIFTILVFVRMHPLQLHTQ